MTHTTNELRADKIDQTLQQLSARIAERFPSSGLSGVCQNLVGVANDTAEGVRRIARPSYGFRIMSGVVVLLVLAATLYIARTLDWHSVKGSENIYNFMQGIDAAVNLLVLTAGGIWFFISLETRAKRRRIQRGLFELRSYAHVIDMHQLTKDPTVILNPGNSTTSSPRRTMTRFELTRYLEYCAEMLALIAKLAALYAGATDDSETLAAVNDVEQLTNNLGRKIWQKIMILGQLDERAAGS